MDQNDQNNQICEQKWNLYHVKVSGDEKFFLAKVKDIFG
jgi:acid stress-induced BolA-like protein IbaG/YrbA